MNLLRTALVAVACVLSASSFAQRALVPIVDHKDVMVATSSGKPVTVEQIRDAIAAAGRRLSWDMAFAGNDLVGTLVVNNKHTISVDIKVDPDRYSVLYRNSINMKYGISESGPGFRNFSAAKAGQRVIHPAYNQWVQALMTSIDSELRKL
jgi:hypothetical protein